MKTKDLSRNQRIASLTQLTKALASTSAPSDTFKAVIEAMQNTYGPNTFIGLSTRGLPDRYYRIVQLRVGGVPIDGFDSWEMNRSPVRSYPPLSEIISNATAQITCDLDWSQDQDLNMIMGEYRSVMAVPTGTQRLPMDWAMVFTKGNDQLTEVDLEELILRSTLITSLLDSRILAQELATAHAQIDHEFKQAGKLQRALLPNPLPTIPGIKLAATYETSTRTGGDLYDIFPDKNPTEKTPVQWTLFVGDASGHGAAAAVVIGIIQAIIRSPSMQQLSVSQRMAIVNRQLCEQRLPSAFASAFLATYHVRTKLLTYVSAGHPLPVLYSPDEKYPRELSGKSDLLLGIDADAEYSESTHQFHPGQMLLIYTDGMSESRAPGGSFLESNGLFSAFDDLPSSADELVNRIKLIVASHQQGLPSVDDQTALVIAVPNELKA